MADSIDSESDAWDCFESVGALEALDEVAELGRLLSGFERALLVSIDFKLTIERTTNKIPTEQLMRSCRLNLRVWLILKVS
jgi:hypothetical protein